jgi:hypothetical protein
MPSTISVSQRDIKPFFTDYRTLDSEAIEVAYIGQFKDLVMRLPLDRRVIEVLLEVISIAEQYRDSTWDILIAPPLTINHHVDLRVLEGAGFYQKVDQGWLYHKGGGSIEALALDERHPSKKKSFAGFGAAYPGTMGLHGNSAFLGTKRLIASISEFAGALAYMVTFAQNYLDVDLTVENIIRHCCVPISVISMPAISKLCKERDDNCPKEIQDKYVKPYHQVSKIVLLVPSSTRGTDKHEVDGKWHEARTIFARTLATYDCVLSNINLDTFWAESSQYAFGTAIRSLIKTGMIQDIASAHMQNLYFVPNMLKDPTSAAADFAAMFYRYHFTDSEWELIVSNNLAGWKNAESFAPCCYPTEKFDFSAVQGFFQGLMQEDYNPIIPHFYRILPIPLTLSVVKLLLQKTPPIQSSGKLFEEVLSFFPTQSEILYRFKECLDAYKKELHTLYSVISSIRSECLIETLVNGLSFWNSEAYDLLRKIAESTQSMTDNNTTEDLLLTRLQGISLELLFDEPEHLRNQTLCVLIEQTRVLSNKALVDIYHGLAVKLFINKIINFKDTGDCIEFVAQRIEESIYSNHRRLRNWILDMLYSEQKSIIIHWMDTIKNLMSPWIEDPEGFMESYLSYMFKKDEISKSLHKDSCQTVISYLLGPWDGISVPYVRRYPQFNLIKSSLAFSEESEISLQKLKRLGDLWITFYFDGYDI